MKQLIIGFVWICIFQFAHFSSKGQSKLADSLCHTGQHELAQVFYEQTYFHAQNPNEQLIAIYKKAKCLKQQHKYDKVVENLERLNLYIYEDSIRHQLTYELSLNNYLNGSYQKSLLFMIKLESQLTSESYLYESAEFLYTMIYAQLREWHKSKEHLKKYLGPDYAVSIDSLFVSIDDIKVKNPEKAEKMSYIIPGSGQIYAGKTFRGITSFLLNGGLLCFSAVSFWNGFYFSGTFTGASLLFVFYSGGARHAKHLANTHNEEKWQEAKDSILQMLLKKRKEGYPK